MAAVGHPETLVGRTYLLVILGCFRNEVESDLLRSFLASARMSETRAVADADAILVMTCGFIREACDEGIDTILGLSDAVRLEGREAPIIVVGCMGERYGAPLLAEMPELAAVLGCEWKDDLLDALRESLAGERYMGRSERVAVPAERTVDSSESATLFVKVADGCSRACGFCTIPSIKGPFRSRPAAEILGEVRSLSAGRDREVVLLAQDLTSYGTDLGAGVDLAALLREISTVKEARWLRMLYLQPEGVNERLIDEVASNDRVCDYFDIPFQHASVPVLRRMGRPGSADEHLRLIERIRAAMPGAALRSTVMVGYPGETENDFAELLSFIREARFDWLGAFVFSPEEGTRAADLNRPVPTELAVSRYNTVVETQDGIEAESLGDMPGRELEVVVDELCEIEPYDLVGRSYREAPTVDGMIYLRRVSERGTAVMPGSFVMARVTGHEGLDLVAEI